MIGGNCVEVLGSVAKCCTCQSLPPRQTVLHGDRHRLMTKLYKAVTPHLLLPTPLIFWYQTISPPTTSNFCVFIQSTAATTTANKHLNKNLLSHLDLCLKFLLTVTNYCLFTNGTKEKPRSEGWDNWFSKWPHKVFEESQVLLRLLKMLALLFRFPKCSL